jgi:hypothetical protein
MIEKSKQRARQFVLRATVIGLTLISVLAGFDFYSALFNVATAVLCCVVFETIRIACLWSFTFHRSHRLAAIPIYVLMAGTCSLASITSFHARIVESHGRASLPIETIIAGNINLIKSAYATNTENMLTSLHSKIDICRRKLASNPESKYWQNRLEQRTTELRQIVAERDRFLTTMPDHNREAWLAHHAALLDVNLEPLPMSLNATTATTQAITELWGLSELQAKKIVSFIIVISVECAIILLSLLARGDMRRTAKEVYSSSMVLHELRQDHPDDKIRQFLERNKKYLRKQGRLPYASELGRGQREMRKTISKYELSQKDILQILDELQNGKKY